MAHEDLSEGQWLNFKQIISDLYIAENRKLEGKGGVRDEMEKRHQFVAT